MCSCFSATGLFISGTVRAINILQKVYRERNTCKLFSYWGNHRLESKIYIFLHVVNQFIAVLGNPKIFSAMVLTMSIYSTYIGHFVFLFFPSKFHSWRCALLLAMSLANRFKNLYLGQLFNFWFSSAFFPQNFTPRDAHCFRQ